MAIYDKTIQTIATADLAELLSEPAVENVRLEFKLEDPPKDEILKKLSSFANTFGGYLVIGAQADRTGRLQALPGLAPINGFKQRLVQWCFNGVSPPIQPFVSDPIPTPQDPTRVCYVLFLPESEEAPHFLNARQGPWVRTDEFSQRFEPRLATFEELQHLGNRRALAVSRRSDLFVRGNTRFDAFAAAEYRSQPDVVGDLGATLKLAVSPKYPSRRLADERRLRELIQPAAVSWRQVGFPRRGTSITQFESVIILVPAGSFSMLDASLWGLLYYAWELERQVEQGRNGIHLHSMMGHLLVLLEHARLTLRALGYDGTLAIRVRLERVRGVPLLWHADNHPQFGPASRLDNEVDFEFDVLSNQLDTQRDQVAKDLLRQLLFALNWADAATDEAMLDRFVTMGHEYNYWPRRP